MAISRTQMRTQLTGDRMPAKSEKQRRYMAMAYNDPDMGVSKEVAKKFMKKPAKGYKKGGMPFLLLVMVGVHQLGIQKHGAQLVQLLL